MIESCINLRNCCISNYGVNIIYLYKNNKIIDVIDSKLRFLLSCLCFVPFKLLTKIIKCYKYDIIYNMDNLYYTTNIQTNHIIPVILYATLYSSANIKKKLFIDTNIDSPVNVPIDNYYSNSPTLIKPNKIDAVSVNSASKNNSVMSSPNIKHETSDNKIDDNKTDDNKIDDNKTDDNKTDDNKTDIMDCSPNNKILSVNSCPCDNDITMIELSNKEITITEIEDNKDIIMIEMSEKKNDTKIDEFELDITNRLKLYNTSIPLWVFINNENVDLNKYNTIKIKYMFNNKIEIIDININLNINRLIYDLFNSVKL